MLPFVQLFWLNPHFCNITPHVSYCEGKSANSSCFTTPGKMEQPCYDVQRSIIRKIENTANDSYLTLFPTCLQICFFRQMLPAATSICCHSTE